MMTEERVLPALSFQCISIIEERREQQLEKTRKRRKRKDQRWTWHRQKNATPTCTPKRQAVGALVGPRDVASHHFSLLAVNNSIQMPSPSVQLPRAGSNDRAFDCCPLVPSALGDQELYQTSPPAVGFPGS